MIYAGMKSNGSLLFLIHTQHPWYIWKSIICNTACNFLILFTGISFLIHDELKCNVHFGVSTFGDIDNKNWIGYKYVHSSRVRQERNIPILLQIKLRQSHTIRQDGTKSNGAWADSRAAKENLACSALFMRRTEGDYAKRRFPLSKHYKGETFTIAFYIMFYSSYTYFSTCKFLRICWNSQKPEQPVRVFLWAAKPLFSPLWPRGLCHRGNGNT